MALLLVVCSGAVHASLPSFPQAINPFDNLLEEPIAIPVCPAACAIRIDALLGAQGNGRSSGEKMAALVREIRERQLQLLEQMRVEQSKLQALLYATARDREAVRSQHRRLQKVQADMLELTLEGLDQMEALFRALENQAR